MHLFWKYHFRCEHFDEIGKKTGFERLEQGRELERFLAHVVAELNREVCVFSLRSALVE